MYLIQRFYISGLNYYFFFLCHPFAAQHLVYIKDLVEDAEMYCTVSDELGYTTSHHTQMKQKHPKYEHRHHALSQPKPQLAQVWSGVVSLSELSLLVNRDNVSPLLFITRRTNWKKAKMSTRTFNSLKKKTTRIDKTVFSCMSSVLWIFLSIILLQS